MNRTFKYRIYPNKEQEAKLHATFKFCNFLYNCALEERIRYYKCFKKSLSYNVQAGSLKDIKWMFPEETSQIYAQVLQQVLKTLDTAYKNFFNRIKKGSKQKGFPRFKPINRFKSICYPQVLPKLDRGVVKLLDNNKKISISKIVDIKIKYHRPIQGIAKQCRIVKENDHWYVAIFCAEVPKEPLSKTGKTIGIDLGISNFITMDDGSQIHHPKTSFEKLQERGRALSSKMKGSNNRKKAKKALSKEYLRQANIRKDFHYKTASRLISEYDTIIIEDLNVKNMLKSSDSSNSLNRNISDAAWGNFVAILLYKAESAGKSVIQVDPRNTSKRCSCCGNVKETLTLNDRTYHCDACGIAIDRDKNAAINIKNLGLGMSLAAHL